MDALCGALLASAKALLSDQATVYKDSSSFLTRTVGVRDESSLLRYVWYVNTLAMAHSGGGSEFRIHHRSKFDAESAKNALGIGRENLERFREQAEFLASQRMDDVGFSRFLDALFPTRTVENLDGRGPDITRPRNYARAVEALVTQTGACLNEGTWWQGYNAITYMVDHMNPAKDKSRALNSSWFGTGEKLKVQALNTALEMAK